MNDWWMICFFSFSKKGSDRMQSTQSSGKVAFSSSNSSFPSELFFYGLGVFFESRRFALTVMPHFRHAHLQPITYLLLLYSFLLTAEKTCLDVEEAF